MNAAYQALIPMPLPESMTVLKIGLGGFAAFVALLYFLSIIVSLKNTPCKALVALRLIQRYLIEPE
ncbi:MAG: hypothetical protein ACRENG_33255 [bacterium]